MTSLDITYTPTEGRPPDWASRQLRGVLAERGEAPTRVRIGEPGKTKAQHGAYFLFLQWISAAYYERGEGYSKDLLHEYYKALLLPIVAAQMLEDSGEEIDIGPVYTFPDGTTQQRYSITKLSKAAMARYLELIAADDDVIAMNVPIPSEEGRYQENPNRTAA